VTVRTALPLAVSANPECLPVWWRESRQAIVVLRDLAEAARRHERSIVGIVLDRELDQEVHQPLAIIHRGRPYKVEKAEDVVVFAGNDIPAKPHSRAFLEALSRLNTSPQNAVFAGDSMTEDATGAADVGMTTVWLSDDDHPSPDIKPDFRIQSIEELLPPPWEDR